MAYNHCMPLVIHRNYNHHYNHPASHVNFNHYMPPLMSMLCQPPSNQPSANNYMTMKPSMNFNNGHYMQNQPPSAAPMLNTEFGTKEFKSLSVAQKAEILDDLFVEWKAFVSKRGGWKLNMELDKQCFTKYYNQSNMSERYKGLCNRSFRIGMNRRLKKMAGMLVEHGGTVEGKSTKDPSQVTMVDNEEGKSNNIPLSMREHGLDRINDETYCRFDTKSWNLSQLLNTWQHKKPVPVGDKELIAFEDLLQSNQCYWSFDITSLDGFNSIRSKRLDENSNVAVRKVFLHNSMPQRKTPYGARNGYEYIEGGKISNLFEPPEEYIYKNPDDGSVLILHWLVKPTNKDEEYNYALMSSVNYTDEAIIKDAERETEKRCSPKHPYGRNISRSGYATSGWKIYDGEENKFNANGWKGSGTLRERNIKLSGNPNILQGTMSFKKADGTMKKDHQCYGSSPGHKETTTDVQKSLLKDPNRCLQIVEQMEARFISLLLITGMEIPGTREGKKVPTTLGSGHEENLWAQFNDAMYDYEARYDTYIESLPMLTDWQIFMVIYYLQNGLLINQAPTNVHCDSSKYETAEQQEMVALLLGNKTYGNTTSAKAAALSEQVGNTHFPTVSASLEQRPGRDTVTMRLSGTPHAGCRTRGQTNVSRINHSRKKEDQPVAARTRAQLRMPNRRTRNQNGNNNQQQQGQVRARRGRPHRGSPS